MPRSNCLTRYALLALAPAPFVLLAAVSCSCNRTPFPEPPLVTPEAPEVRGTVAITNVTVVDVAGGTTRPNLTVVIRGERIAGVLPADGCRVVGDTRVIDGTGKFLAPGLWDMHAHLVHDGMIPHLLRHGVTGVRHMFGYNPTYRYQPPKEPAAAPAHPRVVAAHQLLDGQDTVFPGMLNIFETRVVKAQDAAGARAAVRELKARGNDFVKMYSSLSREAFFAAVGEAKALGLAAGGHVPHRVTAGEASDAGYHTIEHLGGVAFQCSSREAVHRARLAEARKAAAGMPGSVARTDAETGWREQVIAHETFDPAKADALFQKFVRNGTWHVPTLVTARAMARMGDRDAIPEDVEKELPELIRAYWERKFMPDGGVVLPKLGLEVSRADLRDRDALLRADAKLVGRMRAAGVGILAGTDTPSPLVVPGVSLHDELELLVGAGLTPAEALRAATLNPARCLGRERDLGTVENGKLADLVLLSADPLSDVRNTRRVEQVVVGGRVAER